MPTVFNFAFIVVVGVLTNPEVVYDWFVDGETRSVSALPVFDWVFVETRTYNVCASVSNLGKCLMSSILC